MMKTPWLKMFLTGAFLLAILDGSTAQMSSNSVHLTMGNPSKATSDLDKLDNFLMVKPQFALSYNNEKKIPNWVSWQLSKKWLGNVRRRDNFRPDPELPPGFRRALPTEYTNSGFTRGHMAPSGDRTATRTDNDSTFLMTNIIPQTPDNNSGPWNKLEEHCRQLVKQGKELYIISGGYGQQRTIAVDRISVPEQIWKVVVIVDNPNSGADAVTQETKIIAVDMPNRQGIGEDPWEIYRVSVDEIETATGYDLLSNVPPEIQAIVEATK